MRYWEGGVGGRYVGNGERTEDGAGAGACAPGRAGVGNEKGEGERGKGGG